ncbi:apolipo C-II-like protein [Labeo rohita]|uniref:Apolipoprotein C-II n=1 Tax=Labeo rohita TaxID=84645 RepID=A0A498LTY2_LABRO|nr:apolipo C-II-like protein [Labeo rohita]
MHMDALLNPSEIPAIMNKLLVITVVVAFLALGAESFRVPRQTEEEEKGTIATVVDTLRSYYDSSVDTASGYVETIKGYKLDEKAKPQVTVMHLGKTDLSAEDNTQQAITAKAVRFPPEFKQVP